MFDDVFGMVELCADTFRGGVRDAFGASILDEVLDPIRNQIGLLRSFHEEIQHQSFCVEQVLQEAQSMTRVKGHSDE